MSRSGQLGGSSLHQKRGQTFVRPLTGDEVCTPSLRRSEGRRGQFGGRCPGHAASKTSLPTLNGQQKINKLNID